VEEDSESLMYYYRHFNNTNGNVDVHYYKNQYNHDTAVEKEQKDQEGREIMMQNNQKAEEREMMQNDQWSERTGNIRYIVRESTLFSMI